MKVICTRSRARLVTTAAVAALVVAAPTSAASALPPGPGAAAGLALPAGPLGYTLSGIERVEATYTANTVSIKGVSVDCPPGKRVISTGFSVGGLDARENVRVHSVVPHTDWVHVSASEDEDGAAHAWSLTARAVCAVAPPGLVVISSSSPSNSNSYNAWTATCPSGTVAIGAGFALPDTDGQLSLTDLRMDDRTVSVTAYEDDTRLSSSWTVTPYAVCSLELSGRELRTNNTGASLTFANQTDSDWGISTCSTGKTAIAAAAYIDGAGSSVSIHSLQTAWYQPPPSHGGPRFEFHRPL
jgi:hypothetical protein